MKKRLATIAVVLATMAAVLLTGTARAEEWTATTRLDFHAAPRANIDPNTLVKFWGQLHSSQPECEANQVITLLRKGTGGNPDTVVDTTTTDAMGRYQFPNRQILMKTSDWQAVFAGSSSGVHPNIHTCLGSVSIIITVKLNGTAPSQ